MKKDFTITAEVRLIAHWNTPMDSPGEWERRKVIDDRVGIIACDLEEVIRLLAMEQIKTDINLTENLSFAGDSYSVEFE